MAEQIPEKSERRRERRVSCEAIPALVRIDSAAVPARVLDFSSSGIRLGVDFCLAEGDDVAVSFDRMTALGKIRYCRLKHGDSFHAGVQIEDVIDNA